MSRYLFTVLAAAALCVVSVWGALLAIGQTGWPGPAAPQEDPDAAAAYGIAAQGAFETTQSLSIDHGSRVNFWIRNNGAEPVEITIDRAGARVIGPGAEGHITAEVELFRRDYLFRARSEAALAIDYKIAQRA